jgi:predicted restriction endonuclease
MELSRNKNPYYQREKKEENNINIGSAGTKNSGQSSAQHEQVEEKETNSYAGYEAHASQTVKLSTRNTLRSQAAIHRQSIQQDKRKNKLQRKQTFDKQMKQQKVNNVEIIKIITVGIIISF